ncbi:hypothetical protein AURDEDRAFT_178347, partial [Auricularia subglabra TFB-10046 SS5]
GPVQPNQSNQSNQPGRTAKALEEAFFQYLGYLKTQRAELLAAKPPSVKQAKALHDSANGRRLQRSDARVAFIFDERLMQFFKIRTQNNQTRPATKQDIEFLFSTDCTSSDELDRAKVEVDWPALIRAMHAIRAKFQDEADHRLNPQP